jgi:hypothetical protein
MNQRKKISILILLCLGFCSLTGVVAAAYDYGGFVSTNTAVSVIGTVNDTVFIQVIKQNNGTTEKNQWISSYTDLTPKTQSWSSSLSVSAVNGSLGWNLQRNGLPAIWKKLPVPVNWNNLLPGIF